MLVFGKNFVETEKRSYFYPEDRFDHPRLFAIDQADDLHPGMARGDGTESESPYRFDVNREIAQKNKDWHLLASLPRRPGWQARRGHPPKGGQHGGVPEPSAWRLSETSVLAVVGALGVRRDQ